MRWVLLLSVVSVASLSGCTVPVPEVRSLRPNIVFILADDLGYKDLGCYGGVESRTPNLDRLARSGMRFTDAYANGPNCAPSRACIQTGQYPPRHGIYTVGSAARGRAADRRMEAVANTRVLADSVVTLPEVLHQAGYATAHVGKWHLGADPRSQGFDRNVGGNQAGHPKSYFSPYRNPDLQDGPAGEYLTDRLTEEANRILVEFAAEKRPFFLHLSHFAVHTPIQARPDLLAAGLTRGLAPRRARYAAMVESVDQSVGRVLGQIERLGLEENTLVVFFSDNGGVGRWTSMRPLRGAKGMLYEGGIREPLLVRWPGRVPAGVTCGEVVMGSDWYPTLAALAGAALPGGQACDGRDLGGVLTRGESLGEREVFWHFPCYLEGGPGGSLWRTTPVAAVRAGSWKLLEFFEDGHRELYDLARDPGEEVDLAARQPQRVEDLVGKMQRWRSAVGAKLPVAR